MPRRKQCDIVDCIDGWCPFILNSKGNAERCKIAEEIAIKRTISEMIYGVPDRKIKTFSDLVFDINPIESKIKVIRNFVKSQTEILIMISPNGTGKTHILGALLFEFFKQEIDCNYITAKELRELWFTRDTNYRDFYESGKIWRLQNFEKSRIRFVDELGGEGVTKSDHFERNFVHLLRTGHPKFILASNIEPGEIFSDNRTLSTLSGADVIRWDGIDYRKLREL